MIQKRNLLIITLISMMCLLIGIWIIKIISDELPYVDQWARRYVASFENTRAFDFLRVMTEFGSASFLIPFAIIVTLLLLLFLKDWLPAFIILSARIPLPQGTRRA